MKHTITHAVLSALALCSTASASTILSFVADSTPSEVNSSGSSLTLDITTSTLVDDGTVNAASETAAVNDWLGLSGSATVSDSFQLVAQAGFGFSSANPSWNASEYSTSSASVLRWRVNSGSGDGVSPLGGGEKFSQSEILWFEVKGLEAGSAVSLESYTLLDNNAGRLDIYTGDVNSIGLLGKASADAAFPGGPLLLQNGDRFGFGWNDGGSGQRTALKTVTFDVVSVAVPEPSGAALLALGGLALVSRRRR